MPIELPPVRRTAQAVCGILCVALLCCGIAPSIATAQNKGSKGSGSNPFGNLGLPMVGGMEGDASFSASFEVMSTEPVGRVHLEATITDGWHMYSVTQPDGGPLATTIKLDSPQVELTGPFVPDHAPEIDANELVWPGLPIEEHHGTVTWTAPFKWVQPEATPESVTLEISVDGQVCTDSGSCIPISDTVEAKFTGYYGAIERSDTLRVENTQATWSAQLQPANVAPGGTAILSLTADTDPGYHVYTFIADATETSYRTLIVAQTKSGLKFGEPRTDASVTHDNRLDEPIPYHAGAVTWKIPIRVPSTASPGEYPIELLVGFMTCNERACSPQSGLTVAGNLVVAAESESSSANQTLALGLAEVDFRDVVDRQSLISWIDTPAGAIDDPLRPAGGLELWMVFAGLAGGFILNFMPCVLPVIGLKLMSFVNQSGSNHSRVVMLNLAYVGGILAVMLGLALVTVLAKVIWGSAFGWGEQFTVLEFKVVLAALVFAMALSFLGVWEIPIPGFAMSSKSGELMEKEGPWGAFLKGILTTVLATPCSGPLLGSLFGLSLTLSAFNVILLYMIVGLGMSLPYLALCLSPGLIKLLPKPGAWMETLKQALAFPLLLTVVFFVASIDTDHRIATLILLIVVWFACWLIGRVPAYAERARLRAAWLTGIATIAVGAFVSFSFFGPITSELKWIPYNEVQLSQLRQEGKTVMIDFTANWCINCQINTRVAIDKKRVAELVAENDVVPMLADWTGRSEEIRQKLEDLQSNSIPLLAIFPPDPAAEPILLRDLLTESQVVEALKQAGPSRGKSKLTSAYD